MTRDAALRTAISLLSVPTQVRALRAAPLPEGTPLLLSIAAGDEEAIKEAEQLTSRQRETLINAAGFFIEQIMFGPDSDSYRVLGSQPGAPANELRAHMALLMKWLHPDVNTAGQKAVYIGRVTRAWEDLKTPERRQSYDLGREQASIQTRRPAANFRLRIPVKPAEPGLLLGALARLVRRSRI